MQQKCGCCCCAVGSKEHGIAGDVLCWRLGVPRAVLTVPFSLQPSSDFHRRLGSRPGCASGVADH